MSLVTIPLDTINIIISYLNIEDQLSLFKVNRRLNNIVTTEYWLKRRKDDFPHDNTAPFYPDNFTNYLSCRARYLIARCYVLKNIVSKASVNLKVFTDINRNSKSRKIKER